MNALNAQAHRELHESLDDFAADPGLHVAVITGAGDKAFCVGSDLKERAIKNADDHPPTGFGGISHRFDLLKPVIAAVNGLAIGGGVEIIAACDLAIAADHAEFSLPEPRVGLAALGGGGLQRLARNLALKQAMDLVLTGRRIRAAEAKAMGLINDAVPKEQLRERVRWYANQILEGAPLAIQASKQVMLQSLSEPSLEKRAAPHLSCRRAHARQRGCQGGAEGFRRKTQTEMAWTLAFAPTNRFLASAWHRW